MENISREHAGLLTACNHLRLFALDLALSKIERNRQRDRDEVKHLALTLPLDLNVLKDRNEKELRPGFGQAETRRSHLKLWIERLKKKGTGLSVLAVSNYSLRPISNHRPHGPETCNLTVRLLRCDHIY